VFQVSRRERELLLTTLKLYPRIPAAHHKLSKLSEAPPADQALLDEAVAEQRAENQRRVHKLLTDPVKWVQTEHGWRLSLAESEVEWALQVLNDIRVGSWVLLGCPEEAMPELSEETAPHIWAMEVSGAFQSALLQGLEGQQ
jgi:hypothetical protein